MASLKKRGKYYYAQVYVGGKQKRLSLGTDSVKIAREKLRRIESAQAGGANNPLPTRTPIGQIVHKYVEHIRVVKTPKSAQTDIYYLRDMFGPCCDAVQITSRRPSAKARKQPRKPGVDSRLRPPILDAACFEAITTSQIQHYIDRQVRGRGLAPKTANRYREIACRLFNWSMKQGLIRMPERLNPAASVERYREPAPKIRFLTLAQIDEQLQALEDNRQLQTMVAVLIYAGLRREELLWLTTNDIDLHAGANGMIRVRAKTIDGRFWQPKTKVNRAVPISQTLMRYLIRYQSPDTEHRWYFPSPRGRWWDPDNLSATLRNVQMESNLPWSCLDFRHTFASQLAQKGINLFQISTLLGNSSTICRKHYAALLPEYIDIDFASASSNCNKDSVYNGRLERGQRICSPE